MRIGVFGAGAVGGYLGVSLSAAGAPVTLIGRPNSALKRPQHALRVDGTELQPRDSLQMSGDPSDLDDVALCLVTVKARDTSSAATTLARVLPPDAIVVSFQNGLRNAACLRDQLGDRVVSGVISYNVFTKADGSRQQATSGELWAGLPQGVAGQRMRRLRSLFARSGERLELRTDIERIVAGKLLLNLNNGICAAAGLGIADAIRSADARWCFAHCMREAAQHMRANGIAPARVAALPPRLLVRALLLPSVLIRPLLPLMIRVDDAARSSTLQDLDRGRSTEIDELNGAIVWLADKSGGHAPLNDLIVELVHQHEQRAIAGQQPHYLSARELRQRMSALRSQQPPK
jgi:2-dehydropantoate 2-reductase